MADRVELRQLVTGEQHAKAGNRRRREQAVREVALALFERRHVRDPGDAFAEPRALVVREEEDPATRERPAERGAVLMALVLGRRLVLRGEEVLRVERLRSQELVRGGRHAIRARAGDD